jgi:hypothetical protein
MISTNNTKYPYRVKYVEHKTTSTNKEITSFSIGEKIRNTEKEYQNWKVTVWANLDLRDGDEIVIKSISKIETSKSAKNDKLYYEIAADVEVVGNKAFEEPKSAPYQDDTTLPFDI